MLGAAGACRYCGAFLQPMAPSIVAYPRCGMLLRRPSPQEIATMWGAYVRRRAPPMNWDKVIGVLAFLGGVLCLIAVPASVLLLSLVTTHSVATILSGGMALICAGGALYLVIGLFGIAAGLDAVAGELDRGVGIIVGGALATFFALFLLGGILAIIGGIMLIVAGVFASV